MKAAGWERQEDKSGRVLADNLGELSDTMMARERALWG